MPHFAITSTSQRRQHQRDHRRYWRYLRDSDTVPARGSLADCPLPLPTAGAAWEMQISDDCAWDRGRAGPAVSGTTADISGGRLMGTRKRCRPGRRHEGSCLPTPPRRPRRRSRWRVNLGTHRRPIHHAPPTIPAVSAPPRSPSARRRRACRRTRRVRIAIALNTSLQAPDTGWTAAGNGTASITSGVATITITSCRPRACCGARRSCARRICPRSGHRPRDRDPAPTGGTPRRRRLCPRRHPRQRQHRVARGGLGRC